MEEKPPEGRKSSKIFLQDRVPDPGGTAQIGHASRAHPDPARGSGVELADQFVGGGVRVEGAGGHLRGERGQGRTGAK
ncbi:hypothetical protein GCM10012279_42050 [Micromonospora yangpuensis]|nr:hypothetical protein GCM10012279_42050 [Micromonospora yangpuensis]